MSDFEIALDHRKVIRDEMNRLIEKYPGHQHIGLAALADKIEHMVFNVGSPSSVIPMIKSIIAGKVKYWGNSYSVSARDKSERGTQIKGYAKHDVNRLTEGSFDCGHFRWNFGAYKLNRETRDYLQAFFIDKDISKVEAPEGNGFRLKIAYVNVSRDGFFGNQVVINVKTIRNNTYAFFYNTQGRTVSCNIGNGDVTPVEDKWVRDVVSDNYALSTNALPSNAVA